MVGSVHCEHDSVASLPSAELGKELTVWTARLAAFLYLVALWRQSRLASTFGLFVYLVHVCLAFEYFYNWSHSIALRETERQTSELFGVAWGGGLYLNYLFTALWAGDCAASWLVHDWPRRRRTRLAIHAFLAFIVVNATLVVWTLRAL